MANNINEILNQQNSNEFNVYVKNIDSDLTLNIDNTLVQYDLSWIDKLEECLPYIDKIIRNPRRFIVQDEEIVPIELTKKVTKESIKHLATHTNLIQQVEDDGSVKPSKLLNVYREETYDLYENRFLYSLIQNLYRFIIQVDDKVEEIESYRKTVKNAFYNGNAIFKGEKINFKINYESVKKESIEENTNLEPVRDKVDKLKKIILEYKSNPFIKSLVKASPVKSPIRKTNVFLKETNFKKALELWEFLERYKISDMQSEERNVVDGYDFEKKKNLDFLNYVTYNIVNGLVNNTEIIRESYDEQYVKKFIEYLVETTDISESKLKSLIRKYYKEIKLRKNEKTFELIGEFKSIINIYKNRKEKAIRI